MSGAALRPPQLDTHARHGCVDARVPFVQLENLSTDTGLVQDSGECRRDVTSTDLSMHFSRPECDEAGVGLVRQEGWAQDHPVEGAVSECDFRVLLRGEVVLLVGWKSAFSPSLREPDTSTTRRTSARCAASTVFATPSQSTVSATLVIPMTKMFIECPLIFQGRTET